MTRKFLLMAAMVLGFSIATQAQNVGINSTGNVPNSSAMLDVSAANKGLLIPNVALTGTADAATIATPATSLLVYNTLTAGDVTPGYYYNSGTSGTPLWIKLLTAPADGSETKLVAGNNVSITGSGTAASPYVVRQSPGTNPGDMQYWNGTSWVMVAAGLPGQFLQLMASSIPGWSGAALPTMTTTAATSISVTSASSGGNVTSDGGAEVTLRGVCWGTATNPTLAGAKTTNGPGIGNFTSSLTGLAENTTYFVRAYATNSAGTGYGNEITFKTLANTSGITFNPDVTYGTVSDNDGNEYKTITIGTQTWMAENLKTTKYRNGEQIPNVTENALWKGLSTGAFCFYNNDAVTNKASYGALYNWFAVSDIRNIAPVGWHVPTDAEWSTLTDFIGGLAVAGGKLKETGTVHWLTPNNDASNSTAFTALPGGARGFADGTFFDVGKYGYWWSSTAVETGGAWSRHLYNYYADAYRSQCYYEQFGYSIRCIKDASTVPNLTTTAISSITSTTATSGGNITNDGGAEVTVRGVCWGTSTNPTTENSKTNNGPGTGTFTSSLTGLAENTTYFVRAYATNSVGTAYGTEVSFTTTAASFATTIVDVTNPTTGKTWMDRNLGASRAATSSTDAESYGDLYQWGRGSDGHEKRNSSTTRTLSSSSTPGHGNFILAPNSPYDWRSPQNDNLWQGVSGVNNPCPSGYRLPTEAELNAELTSWNNINSEGAFASLLKLPMAGYRSSDGFLLNEGSQGIYWSSNVDNIGSRYLFFSSGYAFMGTVYRTNGGTVRCIKD